MPGVKHEVMDDGTGQLLEEDEVTGISCG